MWSGARLHEVGWTSDARAPIESLLSHDLAHEPPAGPLPLAGDAAGAERLYALLLAYDALYAAAPGEAPAPTPAAVFEGHARTP